MKDQAQELTVQQAAERTGLSAHTLRYYERIGLMDPIPRAKNGHRLYRKNDFEWIVLLARLRNTGMPIAQMQQFAAMMRLGDAGISQRRALLENHERMLLEQAQTIQQTLDLLRDKIDYYRSWEAEVNGENQERGG
ncbi:MerR family transcriptional regulator [Cohnella sp. AR92]|uniref:MerR family transcriptional regulator n=1 Tax=Cohnella sp. AR92 TaxID=648716 RepID=UPI000F8E66CD|nr:MerR family transcriptional regulator [Cohnella sp. AR92]RUS47430.1 MerR family transcriptional regulator [Cohnella sp. AR92]